MLGQNAIFLQEANTHSKANALYFVPGQYCAYTLQEPVFTPDYSQTLCYSYERSTGGHGAES